MSGEGEPQPSPLDEVLAAATFNYEGVQVVARTLIEQEAARLVTKFNVNLKFEPEPRPFVGAKDFAANPDKFRTYLDGTLNVTLNALDLLGRPAQSDTQQSVNWGHIIIDEAKRRLYPAQ